MPDRKASTMSPKKSPSKTTLPEWPGEKYHFGQILEILADGRAMRATKLEWSNENLFIDIVGEALRYHDEEGAHIFDIRVMDILGDDWVIIR